MKTKNSMLVVSKWTAVCICLKSVLCIDVFQSTLNLPLVAGKGAIQLTDLLVLFFKTNPKSRIVYVGSRVLTSILCFLFTFDQA